MGYLRLFIELKQENTGASCGQARVELQDRPGHIDCKVRCALTGLPAGVSYNAALVSERGGQYREHPVGSFTANARGQAMLQFRTGVTENEGDGLGIGGFKAFVAREAAARVGGKRIVGYRFDPIPIPEGGGGMEAAAVEETEIALQRGEAEEVSEAWEPEGTGAPEEAASVAGPEEEPLVQEDAVASYVAAESEEDTEVFSALRSSAAADLWAPQEERWQPGVDDWQPEAWPAVAQVEETPEVQAYGEPQTVYVVRDIRQVDMACGEAGYRAFERYHHLILLQEADRSFLGMPCRYRPSQQMEVAADGYEEFVTPHGGAPSYGEFGYWIKAL